MKTKCEIQNKKKQCICVHLYLKRKININKDKYQHKNRNKVNEKKNKLQYRTKKGPCFFFLNFFIFDVLQTSAQSLKLLQIEHMCTSTLNKAATAFIFQHSINLFLVHIDLFAFTFPMEYSGNSSNEFISTWKS